MIFFLRRVFKVALKRQGTSLAIIYVLLLLTSSLLVMLAEPAESALTSFTDAVWWAVVTSTTVGYGDLYPISTAGRVVAVILPIFLGVGVSAAFITYLASIIFERKGRKMTGQIEYTGSGHITIVGATAETSFLIEQIKQDDTFKDIDIVLAADLDRHPMPDTDNVIFIKGKPDTKPTLQRASIDKAQRVVIHTGRDEESLFALVNVMKLKSEDCEVTVRCISSDAVETFSSVPGKFEIIVQMTAEMLVQAIQDKTHIPLQTLLTNDKDEEIYYIVVPQLDREWLYWDLHNYLKEKYDFLTFALQTDREELAINPARDMPVKENFGIWLIARSRPLGMDWKG
ncbi:potassium channel family protein [Desulfopila inferna]|uniref:potassium channel family protein n=1 Tax=Desulfopila inferna TaxID=468528 RepID=UPI0019642597|nr:potassium channel family protein [Desulfopila inferna]MBM9604904.1 NAD-binding protein [Desulfopila inferna]